MLAHGLFFFSLKNLAFNYVSFYQLILWQRADTSVFTIIMTVKAIVLLSHMLTVLVRKVLKTVAIILMMIQVALKYFIQKCDTKQGNYNLSILNRD